MRAAFAALLLMFSFAPVTAQTNEIVVWNDTGRTIFFLYISPTSADTWGEDFLGPNVLADGSRFVARVRGNDVGFDVRAIDEDENEYIIWDWTPRSDNAGRLVIDASSFAGAGVNAASRDAVSWLTIVNDTNYTIVEIRAIPAGQRPWDDAQDLLPPGRKVLNGENLRVEVDVERFGTLRYDILLVDEDGDQYVRRNVDLEQESRIVYTLQDLEWR